MQRLEVMKPSILVVDDNQDLRDLIQHVLRRGGFSVATAGSGEDGLAALREVDAPDLVLVDVQMPDMSGLEFLDEVEKHDHGIFDRSRFAFCTAGKVPEDGRVIGHLNKLADLSEMLTSVRNLVLTNPRSLK